MPDPSGSGRVDMLTSPVAAARAAVATGAWVESKHDAARAAVATGAWVKSKHDMYLTRGSVGVPIRRRIKKKKEQIRVRESVTLLTVLI